MACTRALAIVVSFALGACVSDARANRADRGPPASHAVSVPGIAQTGPTMGAHDAGATLGPPTTMPPPRDCTPTWTEVRSPGPRLPRAAVACTSDDECGVAEPGQCCGPCGTRVLPASRLRAVNAMRVGNVLSCPAARSRTGVGIACPACAGRYALEDGYAVRCASNRCQIVRGRVPEGCPPPSTSGFDGE